ncbi:ABC-type transport system involved in multi-copper enzyme maturation, permease component [Halorhabdus sp. SVX81]|uniref:ABC transporter permease subunit n=1 Tax=Halorhabdus sp. SVX81 TaxID=2978283 RepID=UPI0023DC5861|nr:ABC transporter permease subunit [Halorhabdus sp. SVX81]WEL17155.1 ABC-type transport system involved in multi-copper enzyme maturation, permease component [Halorhabdus sp. SVX81]
MSWQVVARKDFHDAIRSRMFWALAAIFGVFSVAVAGFFGYYTDGMMETLPMLEDVGLGLVVFVSSPVSLFVTLVGVIICHKSIIGERESGSLRILLSLPHTRGDVVFGKIVGRSGVLLIPAIASLILGVAVGGVMTGTAPVVPAAVLILGMILLSVTYVSLIVGISAVADSTGVATAVAVGYFIVFELTWGLIFSLVQQFVFEGSPEWMYIVLRLPPSNAFSELLNVALATLTDYPSEMVGANSIDAFYGTPVTALLILLFWLIVPAAIGYRQFSRSDL